MKRFVILILGTFLAFVILKYRQQIKDFVGDIGFAEKIFGMGGTYTFILVFGILVFVFSLMYALGTFQGVVEAVFGRFF